MPAAAPSRSAAPRAVRGRQRRRWPRERGIPPLCVFSFHAALHAAGTAVHRESLPARWQTDWNPPSGSLNYSAVEYTSDLAIADFVAFYVSYRPPGSELTAGLHGHDAAQSEILGIGSFPP